MFRQDRVLTLDIGASKLVLAEFRTTKSGAPELVTYGLGKLGIEPEKEIDSSAYIVATIRELLRDCGIKPAPVLMTVSGQAVFPRYVKLPPVSRDKLMQIISYEAEQNVPFPIDEVVWDYELIDSASGELNVMLVAVKTERVTSLTDCVEAAGLEPEIVDVAPMALYNATRYNYPELEGCTMILDMGARSSNVIFVEANRVFSRSIPVAGNAVTQEIMKEFNLPFKEAESLKLAHAFVAFGGVYAGPDNDVADRVSRTVRTVITRLHAEVNRSVNFYRSQQGGAQPSLVLLTGGSSVIPHMDTFFREKLKVQVQYLNPFVNVPVNEGIDTERIGRDAHLLGEVTGLALRRALICPVEVNLMPPHIVARRVFTRRQPFFALAAVGLIFIMLCWWAYFYRMREAVTKQRQSVEQKVAELTALWTQVDKAGAAEAEAKGRVDSLVDLVARRTQWLEMLDAIHASMVDGMWLTSVEPVAVDGAVTAVLISGRGFKDKLPDWAPVEEFKNRLGKASFFTEETRITRQPPVSSDAYAREFTISVALRNPLRIR